MLDVIIRSGDVVTPQGVATPFPLASGISVGNLAAGADGNLWFIEKNATFSGIGQITPDGIVTDSWLTTKNSAMAETPVPAETCII